MREARPTGHLAVLKPSDAYVSEVERRTRVSTVADKTHPRDHEVVAVGEYPLDLKTRVLVERLEELVDPRLRAPWTVVGLACDCRRDVLYPEARREQLVGH